MVFISDFRPEPFPKLHFSFTVVFILLHTVCTSTWIYTKILVAKEWCSRSLSLSGPFPLATFLSQHTLQSYKSLRASGASVMLLVETKKVQACCAVLMPSHPAEPLDTDKTQLTLVEMAHMQELVRVSLFTKVSICFFEEPLKQLFQFQKMKLSQNKALSLSTQQVESKKRIVEKSFSWLLFLLLELSLDTCMHPVDNKSEENTCLNWVKFMQQHKQWTRSKSYH